MTRRASEHCCKRALLSLLQGAPPLSPAVGGRVGCSRGSRRRCDDFRQCTGETILMRSLPDRSIISARESSLAREKVIRLLLAVSLTMARALPCAACMSNSASHFVLPYFSVRVCDWKGRPQEGVPLLLFEAGQGLGSPSNRVASAVTDSDGVAPFEHIAPGEYAVSAAIFGGDMMWVTVMSAPLTNPVEPVVDMRWPMLDVVSTGTPSGRLRTEHPLPLHLSLLNGETGQTLESLEVEANQDFRFAAVTPGLYYIEMKNGYPGDIAIAVEPEATKAQLDLTIDYTDCGLRYAETKECTPPGPAVKVANLCGKIVNRSGYALGGVRVEALTENPSPWHAATMSDWQTGRFLMSNVPPGRYTLSVSFSKYRTLELPVQVLDGSGSSCNGPIDITLGYFNECSKAEVTSAQ